MLGSPFTLALKRVERWSWYIFRSLCFEANLALVNDSGVEMLEDRLLHRSMFNVNGNVWVLELEVGLLAEKLTSYIILL